MFTRIFSILVMLMILISVPASAENTYCIAAVVVSYETSSFGDLEIEVVDANGDTWAYFADEAHIGDLVILSVFDFEGLSYVDDEIVDVITVSRLTDHEMLQWLIH